jgi:hypothetical protein
MSSPGLPLLPIDVAARRGERCVALATLLMVSLAIGHWDLPGVARAGGAAVVVLAMAYGFAALGWIGGQRRLARIVCRPDGRWALCEAGGRVVDAELTDASRISPSAVWLCWNVRRFRPLLLVRGDIPDTDFRRLLVRLHVAPFGSQE